MKTILNILAKLIGNNLSKVICNCCGAVKSFFQYKRVQLEKTVQENKDAQIKELNEKIDAVTKDGTIEDLIELRK